MKLNEALGVKIVLDDHVALNPMTSICRDTRYTEKTLKEKAEKTLAEARVSPVTVTQRMPRATRSRSLTFRTVKK